MISLAQELESGIIQIRKLKLMLSAESRFKDVIAIIWKHEMCHEFEEGRITLLLNRRYREMKELDETLKNIDAFAELLQCFKGINNTN